MSAVSTYEDDLCSTANLTYQEVAQRIIDMPVAKRMPPVVGSERRHEGFVDPGSSRILRSVLNKWAKQRNYLVARRFTETGNFLLAIQDIRDALTSRMVFVVKMCIRDREREPRKLVHGRDTTNSDAGNRCQKQTEVHRFNIPFRQSARSAPMRLCCRLS